MPTPRTQHARTGMYQPQLLVSVTLRIRRLKLRGSMVEHGWSNPKADVKPEELGW